VLKFYKKWDVALEGYSTIGGEGGSVLDDPVINKLAKAKGRSPAQVVLAWHVKRGTIPLVKTSRVERLPENINVCDIKLSEKEMASIDALHRGLRIFNPINWSSKLPYFQ